jgi:Major capsid protein N-terminus
MTGGGLMQLVAYGAQDVYLTGNPQITFFKVVYRRHTNFAMESIENPFNGAPNFGKKVTCTIQRNGDLIHRMYLQATLPQVALQPSDGSGAQFRWLNWIGHNLIDYVEIEIGGQRINSISAEKYHFPMACCAA